MPLGPAAAGQLEEALADGPAVIAIEGSHSTGQLFLLELLARRHDVREVHPVASKRFREAPTEDHPDAEDADTLASYPPAVRRVLPGVEQRRHEGLDNRAEKSHRPTRRRARVLQRFKSSEHAQQFLAPFGPISDHSRPRRHRLPSPRYHQLLQTRFATRRETTGIAVS